MGSKKQKSKKESKQKLKKENKTIIQESNIPYIIPDSDDYFISVNWPEIMSIKNIPNVDKHVTRFNNSWLVDRDWYFNYIENNGYKIN